MSQKAVYKGIKVACKDIPTINHIGMWNNDFEREKDSDVVKLNALYIELKPQGFRDFAQTGGQDYDMIVTLHLGFEHYKTEPELIYDTKQEIHKAVHHLRCLDNLDELDTPVSKLVRIDERQNFDFDNLIVYEIDYLCKVRDMSADQRILIDTSAMTPVITPTIVTEIT